MKIGIGFAKQKDKQILKFYADELIGETEGNWG